MKEAIFSGVGTAIVTPFTEDAVDYAALERLLQRQIDANIDAIIVTGTTGEASTLSDDEKIALWRFAVSFIHGKAKVILGVGSNDTMHSIHLAKLAHKSGADGLLAVTPYYNKCTQAGLIRHYCAIAEAGTLPLIVYNVPSRTGVNLLPETCLALAQHPLIAGIKEAGGNFTQILKLRSLCKDFPLWAGNDDQIVPVISLGGIGVISVLSNLCPNYTKSMVQACFNGDYPTGAKLQRQAAPLIEALFSEVNPIPVKWALAQLGLCSSAVRLPLTELSSEKQTFLRSALSEFPDLS